MQTRTLAISTEFSFHINDWYNTFGTRFKTNTYGRTVSFTTAEMQYKNINFTPVFIQLQFSYFFN